MNLVSNSNPIGRCFCCNKPIRYKDRFCAFCRKPNKGWTETTQSQCGNCHSDLVTDDKYCRICGTKVGDGAYEPYQNLMECIYGPAPEEREHICTKCGYTWTTILMLDMEKYCPICGSYAPWNVTIKAHT